MFSLIVPVYKNQESIPDLLMAVDSLNGKLGGRLEAVFVVDGSPDLSAEILRSKLPDQSFSSKLLVLSRNFGSFSAIRVGMQNANGPYFAVMAADLQEPPELILNFFETLEKNDADVVVGTRESRADPFYSKLSSNIFWATYRKFVVPQMPIGGVDIFGCNRAFRDCLLTCEETNTSLIALIFLVGFRRQQVGYVRLERTHGVSAWTLTKKINYLMDSVFSFTDLPIKFLLILGVVGVFVATLFGSIILFSKLTGLLTLPGYATTILLILFFGGLNTLGLGLVGSYAWRGYENTKRRPLAIVLTTMAFNTNQNQLETKE